MFFRENGLTKPKETKCAYQDHFFLILCENLPIPAMVGDDAMIAGQHITQVLGALMIERLDLITYKIIRVPIARIATEVWASVNASKIAIW